MRGRHALCHIKEESTLAARQNGGRGAGGDEGRGSKAGPRVSGWSRGRVLGFRAGPSEPMPMWECEQAQSVEALLSWGQVTVINSSGSYSLVKVSAIDNPETFPHRLFCPDPSTSPSPSGSHACAVTLSL